MASSGDTFLKKDSAVKRELANFARDDVAL